MPVPSGRRYCSLPVGHSENFSPLSYSIDWMHRLLRIFPAMPLDSRHHDAMRVFCPVSLALFLFAGKRGKAFHRIPGVFRKAPQADLIRVSLIHEYQSHNKGIKAVQAPGESDRLSRIDGRLWPNVSHREVTFSGFLIITNQSLRFTLRDRSGAHRRAVAIAGHLA